MKIRFQSAFFWLLFLALVSPLAAYGPNKQRDKRFDWKILSTPHFEIKFIFIPKKKLWRAGQR
jgi:hypothetical protein